MLVYFRAENFRSIKEPIELDLRAAPRLRRLKGHVRTPIEKDKSLKVLKSAVLYGANASGKSNVLKAIRAAQLMVTGHVHPNSPVSFEPFILTEDIEEESSFYFEYVYANYFYGFGIRFNNERILEESLTELNELSDLGTCVYSRKYIGSEEYQIESTFTENTSAISTEEKREFAFLIKYTPKNRLFLSECEERGGFKKLKDIGLYANITYNFLRYSLFVIFPETKFEGLLQKTPHTDKGVTNFTELLKLFDTGVEAFARVEVDATIFPADVIAAAQKQMRDSLQHFTSFIYDKNEYCVEIDENHKRFYYRINAIHKLPSGENIELALNQESDGTLRLLDLLPTITQEDFGGQPFTFLIDEFDRSLHPNLAKAFLNLFLNSEHSDNDNQLIATTHEAELLDNDLLRRDEIWFVQKEWDSASRLYCLNDYSTRFDKDIHKAYLSGKFGAVPILMDEFKK
jgi:AAA15 family ATPase/GTPase